MPSISVICPTRNRRRLWQSGWLTESLLRQTDLPDELIIAIDNTEDDTLGAIRSKPLPFPVRILQIDKPRPAPFPASCFPDNCLFHAAHRDVIVHVDDDIALPHRFIEHTRHLFARLPNAAVWSLMTFVDEDGTPIEAGQDWRLEVIKRLNLPTLPGGLVKTRPLSGCSTGAIFTVLSSTIRKIGGHHLTAAGYHNQDTLLGYRLDKACTAGSYLSVTDYTNALHLGLTWHMQNRNDKPKLSKAYGNPYPGQVIANGGEKYWVSPWFDDAYTEIT